MDELEVSSKNTNDVKKIAEQFAKEKTDIICGFLKEKEIIEMMHKEEMNELVDKFEQEKDFMRKQFELEKEDLLQGFRIREVEMQNEFQRTRENEEIETTKEIKSKERTAEVKYREQRMKIRQEYEEIIAQKNEEIKTLRRELLRVENEDNKLGRESPDSDIYIKRSEHNKELRVFVENFEAEKLELQRKGDREKAELVQVFSNQTERMNANFDHVKRRMQEDHLKELEFKLEITEKLLSETSALEMKRMLEQFEREMAELRENVGKGYNYNLLEKQETIDNLEKEKIKLLNALQTERFSLAKVYNREMSLLTNPGQLSKEDIEVALIDETAKLKEQYEVTITGMEEQHKQKIEVFKRNQRPLRELEDQHRKAIEKLKKDFQNERKDLEAEFRKEQLNLLKSFEFERNDLEQRYEEIINEKELEIQQREEDLRCQYEEELNQLKSIVAKQREELEISKQKLTDLADQMEGFLSEKNRLEERFQKENNQCQTLEKTIEKNLETFENNLKEVEAFYQRELAEKADEIAGEKGQLQQLEKEKVELQMKIETLKAKLEEFQLAESALEAKSKVVLENALAQNIVGAKPITEPDEEECMSARSKSPLEEEERNRGKDQDSESNKNKQINDCLHDIRERLRNCIPYEGELKTLEDFQMSNKQMKDAINQGLVEIDKLCGDRDIEDDVSAEGDLTFSFEDQLKAVENILTESNSVGNIDKSVKNQLNERMQEILMKSHRLHKLQKLKMKEEHDKEKSELLKELTDEGRKKFQESVVDLKNLQHLDRNGNRTPRSVTEERGPSTNGHGGKHSGTDTGRRDTKEKNEFTHSEVVDELRREKEEMKRSIEELEKRFNKEKEELIEKLHTQHKEFVMSDEGEIIENLLKQNANLEEAFNLERFYLSRLYYLEMKEELEDILGRRREKMKREFDRDKMNIILKYESDIADLHKLVLEKDEMEVKLLQDRNTVTKKLLAAQRKDTPEKGKRERRKNKERLERDKENLEVTIPLKKQIADLQKKRYQEHESAVAYLKDAVDLLNDITSSTSSAALAGDQQFDRLSFLSEDPLGSLTTSPIDKASDGCLKLQKQVLVSEEEIRNKEELQEALENLVEVILNEDEESVFDSETTSGASSDLESDDAGTTALAGESDEGAFSGPESTEGETLNIKKEQLNLAFNLERFNLGRVYYGEYRDSLRKALKKLAKAKGSLRSKRKQLENDMLTAITSVVSRTNFGEGYQQASKRDIGKQKYPEEGAIPMENTEDVLVGGQLTDVNDKENDMGKFSKIDTEKLPQEAHPQLIESLTESQCPAHEKLTDAYEPQKGSERNESHDLHGKDENKNVPLTTKDLQTGRGKGLGEIHSGEVEPAFATLLDAESEELQRISKNENESGSMKKVEGEAPFERRVEEDSPRSSVGEEDALSPTKCNQGEEKDDATEKDLEKSFANVKESESELIQEHVLDEGPKTLPAGNEDEMEFRQDEQTRDSDEKDTKEDTLEELENGGDKEHDDKITPELSFQKEPKDDDTEQLDEGSTAYQPESKEEKEEGMTSDTSSGKTYQSGDKTKRNAECEQEPPFDHEVGLHPTNVTPVGLPKNGAILGRKDDEEDENEGRGEKEEEEENLEKNGEVSLAMARDEKNADESYDLSRTSESGSVREDENEEEQIYSPSASPVGDQNLINQLKRNNKVLQDKFNLLRELVGKGFVDEIPELSDTKIDEDSVGALLTLSELFAEKEQIVRDVGQIDSQMKELSISGNRYMRGISGRLDEEESEILHALEEIEKQLKKNSDKDLVEHLLKEKEEVCMKLDEINNLLNGRKEEATQLGKTYSKTVPGLMRRIDDLKDEATEKAREVSCKSKMLEAATEAAAKENEKLNNSLNGLKVQSSALQDSSDAVTGDYPYKAKKAWKKLPPEIASLLESKAEAEHKTRELEKKLKKMDKDLERDHRMLEERTDRLRPFKRKQARLEKALKLASALGGEDSESAPRRDKVKMAGDEEDSVDRIEHISLKTAHDNEGQGEGDTNSQEQKKVVEEIKDLNLAISRIELPCKLDQALTDDTPTDALLETVNQAKLDKQDDLKLLEAEIRSEQNELGKAGIDDPADVTQHLQKSEQLKRESAKLDNSKLSMDGCTPGAENPDVQKLANLLFLRKNLQEKIANLQQKIFEEQGNFLEAREFKRTGKVHTYAGSKTAELIEIKAKLGSDLLETNETILQSLTKCGITGPHTGLIEECVERKVRLEEELNNVQDEIDGETIRAAEMLAQLLGKKTEVNEELRKSTENVEEGVRKIQGCVSNEDEFNNNIPQDTRKTVSEALHILDQESVSTPEEDLLCQRQSEKENILEKKAGNVIDAKRRGQDQSDEEEALENAIREEVRVNKKLQMFLEDNNAGREKKAHLAKKETSKQVGERETYHMQGEKDHQQVKEVVDGAGETADSNLGDRRGELEAGYDVNDDEVKRLLKNAGWSDEQVKHDLERLRSLVAEKVALEAELEQLQLTEDLLRKRQNLEKFGDTLSCKDGNRRMAHLKSELGKYNAVIKTRQRELQKIESRKDARQEVYNQMRYEKEELGDGIERLDKNIRECKDEVAVNMEELQRFIDENTKRSNEEQQALRQELEILRDDIQRCGQNGKELEEELDGLKKEDMELKGDALDMKKLLVEKERLREYLIEIDAALDNSNSGTGVNKQENAVNMDELKENRRGLEEKLQDVRDQKTKLDIEYEDEEIDGALGDLVQLRNDLEKRDKEISVQIRGSGVLGRLAQKTKASSSEIPPQYIQGILDEMARDEKTLTELIKEQKDLKTAAQRQRNKLQDTIALVKSKVGEDLVDALAPPTPDSNHPDTKRQYQLVLDEVESNEATISDIVEDLVDENTQLRVINNAMNSELDMLQYKVGEELVNELLSHSLPAKELEFEDVINAVKEDEKTLADILGDQKDQLDALESALGKGLFDTIVPRGVKPDSEEKDYAAPNVMASTLMKHFDDDLETVIVIYEKELNNLSRTNEMLKEMLGENLAQQLLEVSENCENEKGKERFQHAEILLSIQDETQLGSNNSVISAEIEGNVRHLASEGLPLSGQGDEEEDDAVAEITGQESARLAEESASSKDVVKGGITPTTEGHMKELQLKPREREHQDDHPIKMKQPRDVDHTNAKATIKEEENDIASRLFNVYSSCLGYPQEQRQSVFTDEGDGTAKCLFDAPKLMRDNGKTLGEILAQYERDLQQSRVKELHLPALQDAKDSSTRDPVTEDLQLFQVADVDKTMRDIVEAQDKNMEMLQILRERLGEDLVDTLIKGTEEEHSDDLLSVRFQNAREHPEGTDDHTGHLDRATFLAAEAKIAQASVTELKENELETRPSETMARETPYSFAANDAEDVVQRHRQEEGDAYIRKLKAPNIALQSNKTLADVIASYEDGLESLQSKLGPSLTRTLLAMGKKANVGIEFKGDEEATQGVREDISDTEDDKKDGCENSGKGKEADEVDKERRGVSGSELVSADEDESYAKELKAPDIMATSGKTLEEVIEDYEERLSYELNQLQKEVSLLKEKLGDDLYFTLLIERTADNFRPKTGGETMTAEKEIVQPLGEVTKAESTEDESERQRDELKAKSLLQDEGKTVENILRGYEKQLVELTKLVSSENGEGALIPELISDYEDKIEDLKRRNRMLSDRLANLSECIGQDLMHKLEGVEEGSSEIEDVTDVVNRDCLQAPLMMKKEDITLENVVKNYERELDVLRNILPLQDGQDQVSLIQVATDYEDKLDNLQNGNKRLQHEYNRLVNRIGEDLADDIMSLKAIEGDSREECNQVSVDDLPGNAEVEKCEDNIPLYAPVIMNAEDVTMEAVLIIYEKALGLLPRPSVTLDDDSHVDTKIKVYENLDRENKILKHALGDELATKIIATTGENALRTTHLEDSKRNKTSEMKLLGPEKDLDDSAKQPANTKTDEKVPLPTDDTSHLDAINEGRTIEDILKSYEEKFRVLRKLVPNERSEGTSVLVLATNYENNIEKLENEKEDLTDKLNNLARSLGPGLMDDLQTLNAGNDTNSNATTPFALEAPALMRDENNTLEEVLRIYENELDDLRRLMLSQGSDGSAISDIINDYEEKLREIGDENNNTKDELLRLRGKLGHTLVVDLNNLEARKYVCKEGDKFSKGGMTKKTELKAPDLMIRNKIPLEDVLASYEQELCTLTREIKIYEEGLGKGMTEALQKMAEETEIFPEQSSINESNNEVQDTEHDDPGSLLKDEVEFKEKSKTKGVIPATNEGLESLKHHCKATEKEEKNEVSRGLRALDLLREEGMDITRILQNYEKELEALRAINRTIEGAISISDLVKDYENKIRDLEDKNVALEEKTNRLAKTIGQDLFSVIDKIQSGEGPSSDKDIDLNVVNVMKNEDRSLENVLKGYEGELTTLRKLVPGQSEETRSLSDILKEYQDKIDDLQRQNRRLKIDFDALEDKIGSNLFADLRRTLNSGTEMGNTSESETIQEKGLTLENLILAFEKDLEDSKRENTILKDGIGQRLAETLLNAPVKDEGLPATDDQCIDVFSQGKEQGEALQLSSERNKAVGKGGKPQIEQSSLDDSNESSNQPLGRDNCSDEEVENAGGPGDLKAEYLITDEGRTIEDILRNNERQIEALRKLVSKADAISMADLVKNYEDKVGRLSKENDNLLKRLETLEQKIGNKLFKVVEGGESERALNDNVAFGDEERLKAPQIMKEEQRTLENVIRTYEKELSVLRKIIPSEEDKGSSITGLVKEYEDKLDILRTENDSVRNESERLQMRIGHDLVNKIKKMEQIIFDTTEGAEFEMRGPMKDLKVTTIMDVKKSTLEEVIETYESALGKLLSDTSVSVEDLIPGNFTDEQDRSLRMLKQENEILRSSVGFALAQKLLNMTREERDAPDFFSDNGEGTDADSELISMKQTTENMSKDIVAPEELLAETLVREEGRTIENILKNYEKELETLKSLVLNGSGKPTDTFSDLVRKYEDEKDELNKQNRGLVHQLDALKGKIGSNLMKELEHQQDGEESVECVIKSELNVPRIMEVENKTLESVIKCYEKELEALRKQAPCDGEDHVSVLDIIKEYEDQLASLKGERDSSMKDLIFLEDKLGRQLVDDLKKLDDKTFENSTEKSEMNGTKKTLQAPNIMRKERVTLGTVLETYEDTMNKGVVAEHYLKSVDDLKNENEALKTALGEELTRTILDAAISDNSEVISDHDYPLPTAIRKHQGILDDRRHGTMASVIIRAQSRTPYDEGLEELEEKGKEDEITDTIAASQNLKANILIRDEGKTVESILKNYENQIRALSKLFPREEDKAYSTADLIKSYEDNISCLEMDNSGLNKRLELLTERIGKLLMEDLERNDFVRDGSKDELKAPVAVVKEGKTLENIVRNYEKELDVFRRTVSSVGEEECQYTIPDIVREYEDKLENHRTENERLTEKVGFDLASELLQLKGSSPRWKRKWEAVEKIKDEEKTLADILEIYESDLDRLRREKTALEALLNDSKKGGTSALEMMSQYEDEIEDLKYRNRELDSKLSTLFARVGDSLVNDLLSLAPHNKTSLTCSLEALDTMATQDKQLSAVIKQYEDDMRTLKKENDVLERVVEDEKVDGKPLTSLISEYEMKIQEMMKDRREIETTLSVLTERIGGSLADDLLNLREEGQGLQLKAVKLMMNDGKTLSDVLKEYENDLERMKRETRDLASQDSNASLLMEKVLKYENEISELKSKLKEKTALEKKVGAELTKQIMALDENIDGKGHENASFRAIEVMRNDRDVTLCDVVKEYEEELEKKNHEVLALKELISNDILDIAASQESEISELKKVNAVLANELDLLSARIGQELSNELLKRTAQQPTPDSVKLYREVIQNMEDDGKPLQSLLEDLDQKIKLMRGENEKLKNNKDFLSGVSEKIGEELLNQLLSSSESEGTRAGGEPLLEALEVMSREEKTLGDVILMYEKEIARLKTENEALRPLTDNDSSHDSSVIDILSEYEGKIEMLRTENEELHKQMKELTQRVGMELAQELLKLPCKVGKSTTESVKELGALKLLQEGITLTDVLQNYEEKLRGSDGDDLGPLVSGQFKTEEIKLAQLVRIGETEPEIPISKESRTVQEAKSDNEMVMKSNSKDFEDSIKSTRCDSQDGIKKLSDENARLHKKLQQLSKKVGKELTEALMRSPQDEDNEVLAAVKFATVRDLKAVNDVNAERATLAQVLETYEKRLEETLRRGNERPDESQTVAVEIKPSHLARADDVDEIAEEEIVRQYEVPGGGLDRDGKKGLDNQELPQLSDLDLMSLEDLILEKPHSDESLPLYQKRPPVKEDIVQVEASQHVESFNNDFVESRFASDIPVAGQEGLSKTSDSHMKKSKVQAEEDERIRIENLETKVKELENALEEEKHLKERYQKNVQDLLQDIVELKMKQIEDDDDNPEKIRRKIQDDIDLRQDNKRLQEDLKKEKRRRLSVEESKRDLLDEVDNLMREKEILCKQQNEPNDGERLLEDMINLRKKIGDLDTKNRNLQKEVKELKETITELDASHDEEKIKLFATCEKEKSDMMEEHVASKRELEIQLQELLAMNEDLKGTIKSLLEELDESNGRLLLDRDNAIARESKGTEKDQTEKDQIGKGVANLMDQEREKERKTMCEWKKNENLKEQLDETEHALRETLNKYQEEIISLKTEKEKCEGELRQEIVILTRKLELERTLAEQQRKDFEDVLHREKDRLKEDMDSTLEREKKRARLDFEEREDELDRESKKHSRELQQQEQQWNKEREEMQEKFRIEKEKLQKAFDDELKKTLAKNDDEQRRLSEQMNRSFAEQKMEITSAIEKKIYEQLIDKNLSAETDFQELLSKILQEHSRELEGVENDIRKAEKRFEEDKNKLREQSDKEKEALKKSHEEEKKALESTVQDLLKEVIKLKNQRKEIRLIHKKEKENMEEIYERDRLKMKEEWESYKKALLSKLQEEFDNKLANETTKLETKLEDLKRELEKSEQRRKELEERLREIPSEIEKVKFDQGVSNANIDKERSEYLKELKAEKKTLEEEYVKKLNEEKRKFEETLQGLRREIGNLQEKRRVIQDKLYNQDPTVVDRHLMEKSLANYKMEMLSKMEEELAQRVVRERKPLQETIEELQREVEDLKRQRWELRNQLRRERAKMEEEFENERETLEKQFLKEKEDLKSKIESRIQREMAKRAAEDKVNRAVSPITYESPQESPRRLRSENTTLRDDNQRLELEVGELTSKLETLESSFQEMMSTERNKVERMKRIQAKMPKKVTFSDEVETKPMDYTTENQNDTILQELRERDHQVRQLMEAKHFYEEVLSELCEEAGLFELDQNVVI